MMTSSPTSYKLAELVAMEITPLDEENGCFLSFRVNGVWVKLAKCDKCELINVYALDLEENDIRFSYTYETGDTRDQMLHKITKALVRVQQQMYTEQKRLLKAAGRCVKH